MPGAWPARKALATSCRHLKDPPAKAALSRTATRLARRPHRRLRGHHHPRRVVRQQDHLRRLQDRPSACPSPAALLPRRLRRALPSPFRCPRRSRLRRHLLRSRPRLTIPSRRISASARRHRAPQILTSTLRHPRNPPLRSRCTRSRIATACLALRLCLWSICCRRSRRSRASRCCSLRRFGMSYTYLLRYVLHAIVRFRS